MNRCPDVYEPPPFWLPLASNLVLSFTIPTSIYTFYLIIVVTPPHTDGQYRMYLLIYHAMATFSSILNALLAIVHYMPAFLMVQVGVLQANSFLLVAIDLILQSLVIVLALVVLLYRFSIVLYGDRKVVTFRIIFFILFFTSCVPAGASALYFQTTYDGGSAKERLLQDCPHFKPLADSHNLIYMNDPAFVQNILQRVIFFSVFSFLSFSIGLAFCLREFRDRTQCFSKATKRLQSRLLLNLALTLSIPSFSHGVPAIGAVPALVMNIKVGLWIPTMIWFLGSFHAVLNCIVFISMNEHYRNQIKKDLGVFVNSNTAKVIPKSAN